MPIFSYGPQAFFEGEMWDGGEKTGVYCYQVYFTAVYNEIALGGAQERGSNHNHNKMEREVKRDGQVCIEYISAGSQKKKQKQESMAWLFILDTMAQLSAKAGRNLA